MTRNQIIEKLFTGKNFNDCIGKMEPEHLRDDLRQEVILIVCELPEDKIVELHNKKQLEFFVVRIILNQVQSNTSPFALRYKRHSVEYNGNHVNGDWENNANTGEGWTKTELSFFSKRSAQMEHDSDSDIEDRMQKEEIEDLSIKEIDNLYWYNAEMVKLYIKHGNYRAIQEHTGIHYSSAYKTIKKSLEEIKRKVDYINANPIKCKS